MSLVLGLTGPNAAGKGEVAARLESRRFRVHSLSDIVREEAGREGVPPTRENLIRIGNRLRLEGGPGVLAERILSRLRDRDVVDSIRNPAEVEVLRRLAGFRLVGVTADTARRFARSLLRKRPGDPETLEEFVARERQENSDEAHGQQLGATFELADEVIRNDGDLEELRRAVDRLLARLDRSEPGEPARDDPVR